LWPDERRTTSFGPQQDDGDVWLREEVHRPKVMHDGELEPGFQEQRHEVLPAQTGNLFGSLPLKNEIALGGRVRREE